jgi:chloramphenicol-sensitive protein RarD
MTDPSTSQGESPAGIAYAVGAFLIWGTTPIYFKLLQGVPAFEILMHRMIWSFLFLLLLVICGRRRRELAAALRAPRTLAILLGTTALVSTNWFVFIWAINSDRILQTSLGYYINPLINVLLGMLFLKERLRRPQALAVLLAAAGVIYLTVEIGRLPWIALILAFTFGFYGLIRKVAPVSALVGLTVETMLLTLPAAIYLIHLDARGGGSFLRMGASMSLLLTGTALVTALPLLLYTTGARKIHFTTVGLLQYIAPSCTFLLAVFVYGEPFRKTQLLTFVLIWSALAIYTVDLIRHHRRRHKTLQR